MGNRVAMAYDAHSRLAVPGVRIYNVDEIPSVDQALRTAPCIVPVFEFESELMVPTATNGVGDQRVVARFIMLIAPATGTRGLYAVTPQALAALDAYLDAVADDPRLDDTLDADAEVTASAAVRYVGPEGDPASAWYAIAITHVWMFYI